MSDSVACPFCEAEIFATAQKCLHCGEEWVSRECQRCHTSLRGEWAARGICSECQKSEVQAVLDVHLPAPSQPPGRSDLVAGILGVLFGPLGLWYKRRWLAGLGWMVLIVLVFPNVTLLGVVWIGMAIHALVAKSR